MILLRQRSFSEKSEKSKKATKEAAIAGGSLGVGLVGGLGAYHLAKNVSGPSKLNIGSKFDKYLKNQVKKGKLSEEAAIEKAEKFAKLRAKVSPSLKQRTKISKFAKSKGGKLAIIGGTAAALGGATYLTAKKKDKKK